MFLAEGWKDYTVLDTGDGEKLERWGKYILRRPDPQIIWGKQKPELWDRADAAYERSSSGGGRWIFHRALPESFVISRKGLSFVIQLTGFKHTGLFPEQCANWDFMQKKIRAASFTPNVLNLFAYTGAATAACAQAGAAVTHIDAAKGMNARAKENLAVNGLSDKPVRIMQDDCLKFVKREQKRGRAYDGILMDPPSYGRSDGKVFRTQDDLYTLVRETAKLLSDTPLFFLISSYTTGLSAQVSRNLLAICLKDRGGGIDAQDLCLPVKNQDVALPCGTTARWTP